MEPVQSGFTAYVPSIVTVAGLPFVLKVAVTEFSLPAMRALRSHSRLSSVPTSPWQSERNLEAYIHFFRLRVCNSKSQTERASNLRFTSTQKGTAVVSATEFRSECGYGQCGGESGILKRHSSQPLWNSCSALYSARRQTLLMLAWHVHLFYGALVLWRLASGTGPR
jgi:hypothetical protein